MKKFIAASIVLAAGVTASFAFAGNSSSEESSKVPPCRAHYFTCPDGVSQSLKCNRNGGVEHPLCTQAEPACYVIFPCR